MDNELKHFLSQHFDLTEISLTSNQEAHQLLADAVNRLLNNHFEKLVSILYRIDVSEEKLKTVLKENPGADAGNMIADLIMERQLQKMESRKKSATDDSIPDEEKW